MRIGRFNFSPGLWPTLATLVLIPLLVSLGYWQLDRALWKQALVDSHAARAKQPTQSLTHLLDSGEPRDFVPVTAAGHYDIEQQLLLDNRIHQGAAGYQVLTPLVMDNAAGTVLVNRGWVPLGLSRAVLPPLPGPDGQLLVAGIMARLPERVFRLDAAEEQHAGWPQVVQNIDFEDFERRLGYPLLPVIIQLDKTTAQGFARDWKPVYGILPDKHRAYAMQWFTLALVLFLIYVGVNSKRTED